MNVQWSQTATKHLQAIFDYIAIDSEQYALRIVDRILRKSEQLRLIPEAGHIVPEYDTPSIREVFEGDYRIIYETTSESTTILAVIHGARLLPDVTDR